MYFFAAKNEGPHKIRAKHGTHLHRSPEKRLGRWSAPHGPGMAVNPGICSKRLRDSATREGKSAAAPREKVGVRISEAWGELVSPRLGRRTKMKKFCWSVF